MEFAYSALEKVIFNEASTAVLPQLLRGLSYKRPFMVASRTLAEKTGDLSVLRQALPVEVVGFNKAIRSHTPREDALELLDQVRESGADVIISVGGGSVIDAGKFVQLAIEQGLKHESEILEYAQQGMAVRGRSMVIFDFSPAPTRFGSLPSLPRSPAQNSATQRVY